MAVGTAAKACRSYGWHTYNWTTYYPPADQIIGSGGVWNAFSATIDTQPDALQATGKTNYNGTVTVYWGERPGAYTAHSLPIPVTAGVSFTYRLTTLKRKKTYYINGYANVQTPNPSGLPLSTLGQYGEVSVATS